MRSLAILGASGHGKVVAEAAESTGWDKIVFFDDAWPGKSMNGHWPVVGGTEVLLASLAQFDGVVVAIGNNRTRLEKSRLLFDAQANLATIIHKAAVVSPRAVLGLGTVVFAGAIINVDARLGQAVIVNTGATIDHDCVLGDVVHVSPGSHLAGTVTVGEGSWIGIGASVRQNLTIGKWVMVGAGAAVVADFSDEVTVSGVPAAVRARR